MTAVQYPSYNGQVGPNLGYPYPNPYLGGWNSNSFACTLLNSVGLAYSYGNLPVRTPGWGYQVPGLTQPQPFQL
jgi:hypothetical protein